MVPSIGHTYIHNDQVVHCQDRDNLAMSAKVGVPDENNIIWDPFWVFWSELRPDPNCRACSKQQRH